MAVLMTKQELARCPNGTAFYVCPGGNVDYGERDIHILCGAHPEEGWWNGEFTTTPDCEANDRFPADYNTTWQSWDTANCDYDDTDRFLVLSKGEILHVIHLLLWALSEGKSPYNEDLCFE